MNNYYGSSPENGTHHEYASPPEATETIDAATAELAEIEALLSASAEATEHVETLEEVTVPETPAVFAPSAAAVPSTFGEISSRLTDNLTAATLRLVDSAQDFTGLIQAFVAAGEQLERSLESVRALTESNQVALTEARDAASEASRAAVESKDAQRAAVELVERTTREHLAVADLTDNLRQRIAALSVLGAPLPRREDPDGNNPAAA